MTYRLGVDLGTTFTAAAVANGGPPSMLGLGNRALQIPSVLYLQADGELLVGEAAERRGTSDPTRLVREFKRRIGDHVPMLVAGVPYSPQALTAQLLQWVVRVGTEQLGEPPARVILTYPANWGPYKRELLKQVIELADVGEVQTCSEPEAAAVQYATRTRVQPGDRIAVYDLGGGTFDTCVLQKTADGFAMLGEPVGIEQLGGIDFDDAVFQHVLSSLGDRVGDLDVADPQGQAAVARLRRDCVEAKEALSTDVSTVVPVVLPGWSTSVRLNRSELEELIRPPLQETVAAVGRAIRSARVEPSQLRAIVLIGGGSRIPLVRELLQQEFAVPVALDTHPKHDVALGAVLVGAPVRPRGRTGELPLPKPADPDQPEAPDSGPLTQPIPAVSITQLLPPVPVPEPVSPVTPRPPVIPRPPVPARRPRWKWRPHGQVAVSVAAVLALAGGVVLLTQGDDGAAKAGTGVAISPSSSPRSTPAPTIAALPVSAPITDQELIVPMKVNGNWDLYLADGQKSQPIKRLTSDPEADSFPELSTDRRTIIFVRTIGKIRTLRVMAVDGSGQRALFDHTPPECAGSISRPGWNPKDPTELVAACIATDGSRGLFLLRTNGDVIRRLPISLPSADDATFSPDGRQVAYQAAPVKADGGSIFIINVDGSSPRRLTNMPPGTDADPAWSADGTRIAFRRRLDDGTKGGNADIFVAPADGSAPARDVVKSPASDQDPAWSPHARNFAFKSNRVTASGQGKGLNRIWFVKIDGSKPRPLWLHGPSGEQTAPAWIRR